MRDVTKAEIMPFRLPYLAWSSDKPDPTILAGTHLGSRMPVPELELLQEAAPCRWQHTLVQLLMEQPCPRADDMAPLREGPYCLARRSRGIGRHHGR